MRNSLESKFANARVLVTGDLMLDEYVIGSVGRISPEAPVPVVDVKRRTYVAGGAANVAANIRSLGGAVNLIGLVSEDNPGAILRSILDSNTIGISGLVDAGDRGTICKTRIVAGQQQIVRIDHEDRSPINAQVERDIAIRVRRLLPESDVCVVSDYAKGMLTDQVCSTLIHDARQLGKPVIVDPKGREFLKYRGCSVITPNAGEAALASGVSIDNEESLDRAGNLLLEMLPGTRVLITRGADGMTLFSEGLPPLTIPALARRVFDVVGAGDTVVATLALSLAAGLRPEDAIRMANVAAGIVVEKPGTATLTMTELLQHEQTELHLPRFYEPAGITTT